MIAAAAIAAAMSLVPQPARAEVHVAPEISEARGLRGWELDGSGAWAVRGDVLVLEKPGTPGGPFRRPAALAILDSPPVTSFTFEVDVRSTALLDLPVRDVQIVFGYQSPAVFYYVHLSAKTDAVHNGIFLVDRADRRRLDEPTSTPRLTDQAWHRVRVERDPASGRIAVFFDDGAAPVLSAVDRTLLWGRVGVGSFDETAEFRRVVLRGAARAAPAVTSD